MALAQQLVGLGLNPLLALHVTGAVDSTEAGAGTVQSNATKLSLKAIHNIKTAANNSGVILPPGTGTADGMQPGDSMLIFNNTANSLLLYPPTSGIINGGSANASITLTTLQKALVTMIDATNYTALVS